MDFIKKNWKGMPVHCCALLAAGQEVPDYRRPGDRDYRGHGNYVDD